MRFKLLSAAVLAATCAAHASADVLAFKVGAQGWNAEGDDGFNTASQTVVNGWAAFEHPIPIVPNIKVRAAQFDADDNGDNIKLQTADYILYYEILDNPVLALDIGVGAHHVRSGELMGQQFEGAMPEVYASARFPFFDRDEGLGFYAEGVAASVSDVKMTDLQAGISYSFSLSAIDLHLMAGYRKASYEYDGFDGMINGEQNFDGVTVGFEIDI